MTLNARSIATIRAAATIRATECDILDEDDSVTVRTYLVIDFDDEYVTKGRHLDREVEAHQLENGRWMLAHWSDRHAQWQSSDFTASFAKTNPQACYCFARKIEALKGDIRTYPTAAAAFKAAFAE